MGKYAVRTDGLCKYYPGSDSPSLSEITFSVPTGTIVSVIGDNGSGKSTLVEILAGVKRKTSGSVEVLGRSPGRTGGSVGFLPQRIKLFGELTVNEILDYYHSAFGNDSENEDLKRFLNIDEFTDKRISTLSGGMERRVAIGCILASDPELIIMDEPAAGLDYDSAHGIWELILSLKSIGKTVIVATHERTEAWAHSDLILMLKKGHQRYFDGPREIRSGYTVIVRNDEKTEDIADEIHQAEDIEKLRMILDELHDKNVPDDCIRIERGRSE